MMKVAVVGSRNLSVKNLGKYLPAETDELVSGGAKGIDACARDYAKSSGIALSEYLPEYSHYGKYAPLERNKRIVSCADFVIAFWDGESRGTKFVVDLCRKQQKPSSIFIGNK